MEIQEREYYIAGDAETAIIDAWEAHNKQAGEAMTKVAEKYGGKPIHNGHKIVGLVFENDPPKDWVKKGSVEVANGDEYDYKPFYLPKRPSKNGTAIVKELEVPRFRRHSDLHKEFCNDGGWGTKAVVQREGQIGMRLIYTSFERIVGKLVVGIPIGSEFAPSENAVKLKMSQYWALREQEE